MKPLIKENHLVGDVSELSCPYCKIQCDNKRQIIDNDHLISHGKDIRNLREEFPDHITITLSEYQRVIDPESKIAKCYYYNDNDCSKDFRLISKYKSSYIVCDTCIKLGKENPDKRTKAQANDRRKKTLIENYGNGVTNAAHVPGVKEKKSSHGPVGWANPIYATKGKKTMVDKWGVDNIMKTEYGKQFFRGENNPMRNPDISVKVSRALRGRTSKLKGRDYNNIHGNIKANLLRENKKRMFIKQFLERFEREQEYLDLKFVDEQEYQGAHIPYSYQCRKCNHIFKKDWNSIQQGYLCPKCFPRNNGISKGEKELLDFIKSICNYEIIENSRKIIPPREIDIFIPEIMIAIEFNGLYWHSEEMCKDKHYHLSKTIECSEKGIRLIQIFEDEWVCKKNIVKGRLRRILNVEKAKRIHGRKCIIREIESNVKNDFLNKYHIQGCDKSTIKLGAFNNDELISVMTFSKGNPAKGSKNVEGVWELNRFCSKFGLNIPGIAGKLLSHFKKNYDWIRIFSYADLRWSTGNVYFKLGFDNIGGPILNYWYVKGLNRIHRFAMRKRPDEPKNITEKVLRAKEGYSVIWDCGNLKFTMINGG